MVSNCSRKRGGVLTLKPLFSTSRVRACIVALLSMAVVGPTLRAGEWPYFITYSHQMEEPGNLEIATRGVTGKPAGGNRFLGSATELEYGVTGWWTTEVYL